NIVLKSLTRFASDPTELSYVYARSLHDALPIFEVPTGEKSMFGLGKEIMKTEKKPTKNVVISERDYKNLVTAARDNDRLKQHVRNLMSTDMAREYKKLSKEHGQVKE